MIYYMNSFATFTEYILFVFMLTGIYIQLVNFGHAEKGNKSMGQCIELLDRKKS